MELTIENLKKLRAGITPTDWRIPPGFNNPDEPDEYGIIESELGAIFRVVGMEDWDVETFVNAKAAALLPALLDALISEMEENQRLRAELPKATALKVQVSRLTEALQGLADCAGLTWLPGFKNELDAAMVKARAALGQKGADLKASLSQGPFDHTGRSI